MATVLKTYNLDDKVKDYREYRLSHEPKDKSLFDDAHYQLINTVGCKALA